MTPLGADKSWRLAAPDSDRFTIEQYDDTLFPYNLLKVYDRMQGKTAAVDNAFALTKNDDSALNRENIVNHLCIAVGQADVLVCAGAFHREVKTGRRA
jgi:hypothetical protein